MADSDVLRTGRLPGELRSTTEITEIVPEKTLKVPARTDVRRTYYGPCLVCGRDIKYEFWFDTSNQRQTEDWLLKQFSDERRKAHISQLEGRRKQGYLKLKTIEGIICEPCRSKCAEARSQKEQRKEEMRRIEAEQKKAQRERDLVERERWVYHTTWRDALKQEFINLPDGVARFRVTRGRNRHNVLFRWRAVSGRCRGDSPRNVVGMWVDRRFVTRYYGWNIQPLEGERPYSEEDVFWKNGYIHVWPPPEDMRTQDVFAVGFCHWLERSLQKELLTLRPVVTWRAKLGSFPIDEIYPSTDDEDPIPHVVHTEWTDGSKYARIVPAKDLASVIEFAARELRMRIEPLAE